MKLLGISGALIGAKPAIIINEVLQKAREIDPNIEVELLDLRNYKVEFVDGRSFEAYNDDTQTVIKKIMEADAFVIGTPIYQASITGALKNLFDHLPTNVFESKVVGLVSTAGSNRHFLVAETQLKPIISFFKAIIPTKNVFVTNADFNKENIIEEEDVKQRLAELASEIVHMHMKLHG